MYYNQRTNDYQSDFLITAKPLFSWKFHVLIFTLLVLLFNCLLQAIVLLALWDWKWSATANLETELNPASRTESSVEAIHIYLSEATFNLQDRLGVYCCEEMTLTQTKVLLLTGVFYVAIYGLRWPVCSIHSQHFVKSHAFTTG